MKKLKFTAYPQSKRQSWLYRGKTAWKWTLLFSEVNVRVLMTFFIFVFFGGQSLGDSKILPPKKRSSRRPNSSKYCSLGLRKCNVHLRLRKCEKLPQTCGFAVAEHLLQFCGIFGCVIECKFSVPSSAKNKLIVPLTSFVLALALLTSKLLILINLASA